MKFSCQRLEDANLSAVFTCAVGWNLDMKGWVLWSQLAPVSGCD